MISLWLTLLLVLPARAEYSWIDPAALQSLSRDVKATATKLEKANSLPRLPPGSPEAQTIYNQLFPYYAEVCTVSQYKLKGTKGGGFGGHATMFIHGAELDKSAGYPRLRPAAEGADLSDPDSGVGISVNKVFANVNWVGIPGRDMFFRGGLAAGQKLDKAFFDGAIRRAVESGWFDGIEMHEQDMPERRRDAPAAEVVVRKSIGTDFALNFARDAHCARLPLDREKLARVVEHLNSLNDSARTEGYQWSLYTDNCSHTPHNALAATGLWDPKKTRGPGKLDLLKDIASVAKVLRGRMPDLSFPANNFVRVYEAGNERPIDDVVDAFKNRDLVRTMNDGWMSTGPGALVVTYPMQSPELNEMFDEGRDPFIFSLPAVWDKKGKFESLTSDPPEHLVDLRANLLHYRDRYAATLAKQDPSDRDRHFHGEKRKGFKLFYDRFYRHAGQELRAADARLAGYEELASPN